ncbi:hypothetical protein LCGC14_2035810, partial [marine sediment metagenome]
SKKENIFLMTIISAFILTIVLIVLKSPNLKKNYIIRNCIYNSLKRFDIKVSSFPT